MMINIFHIKKIFLTLTLFFLAGSAKSDEIKFTSTKSSDCKLIYSDGNSTEQICPAPNGWSVKITDTGSVSWYEFYNKMYILNTLEQIVNISDLGLFPNVTNGRIEWHITNKNTINGIIFRMTAQNEQNILTSRLFVLKITNDQFSYCGWAKSNAEARLLLKKTSNCRSLDATNRKK